MYSQSSRPPTPFGLESKGLQSFHFGPVDSRFAWTKSENLRFLQGVLQHCEHQTRLFGRAARG